MSEDPPRPAQVMAALDATWPAAEITFRAGWALRRGAGGGKRVSAASRAPGAVDVPDIATAAAAMAEWGQAALFRLAEGDDALDKALEAAGYAELDRTAIYTAPTTRLTDTCDETARVLRVSTPLARAAEIWASGGIGAKRLAVMDRVAGPRVRLLARLEDRPVGVAFVALDGDIAMLHAAEVLAADRRKGAGRMLLHGAANWAAERGAGIFALAVTEANVAARGLYEALGMTIRTRYHYRHPPTRPPV